ncbi:MAG TPA: thiamine pyrophosphate-binding protein [Vicinamibacterales bacterium]|jgi:acetolactate synthase-1/2/3 large subunit|nr:thiamine pyrophosphate-binding protein [Vicinamibacterales bacterium]
MTVADLIVARLRDAGVRAVFGVPGGGSNLDLIEAAQRIGVPFVLTATETAGAIAAIAQAEISGRPGACLTTLGPGVASVVNGVACARLDRAPLVVLTDSHPAAAGDSFAHQRLDHYALLAPATKWSTTIAPDETAGIADVVDRAIACALAPPPGPVHLDVPADVGALSIVAGPSDTRDGDDAKIAALLVGSWEAAESEIARARTPLLIVGLGARRPQDVAAIRSLCARHALPAMVTYKAKGVVPDGDPHFAGVFTNAAIEQPIVDEADLLIGVGLDPVELLPRSWKYSQPIVYCGPWPVEARHVPFAAQLVTDVPAALERLDAVLEQSAWDLAAVGRSVRAQREAICARRTSLTADRVVQMTADSAANIARVTVDAGAHMLPATMLWPAGEPNQMLISNGLSTMGFALPAAIGAALLRGAGDPGVSDARDRAIVALTGDGGLLMCLGELLTAVREKLRIITIVFNDRSLSLIDLKQRHRQYASAGVTLGEVGWTSIAEGAGMPGHVATTEAELGRALSAALDARGPSLIDARIDPSTYSATLRAIRG